MVFKTQYFGLRGVHEHTTMSMNNFVCKVDNGRTYIEFSEDPTKCGLYSKKRESKMFVTGGERCPVAFFDFNLSKGPAELKATGHFYLLAKVSTSDECWYYARPMGHNSISQIMKKIVSGTPLSEGKRLTNHSGRKIVVKKLKAAQIPESSII